MMRQLTSEAGRFLSQLNAMTGIENQRMEWVDPALWELIDHAIAVGVKLGQGTPG